MPLQRLPGPTPAPPQRPNSGNSARSQQDRRGGSTVPFEFGSLAIEAPERKTGLQNPRFTGDPNLRDMAENSLTLNPGSRGPAVHAIQSALVALGYHIPTEWRTSLYGPETAAAIELFNRAHGLTTRGLSSAGLRQLDKEATQPKQLREHYVDYERMLADGRLDITLAVGFETKPIQAAEAESPDESVSAFKARHLRQWLAERKFTRVGKSDQPGQEHYELKTRLSFPGRDRQVHTKEVTIQVNLITPQRGAAAQFRRALNESEITLYTGHARGGMGPDFDDIKSALENFVLGAYSTKHAQGKLRGSLNSHANEVITKHVNDLERMTQRDGWDRQKYRVWFFNACSSLLYLRGIRGGLLPEEMGTQNLDLFGTTKPIHPTTGTWAALTFLDGILQTHSMEQIVTDMNRDAEKKIGELPGVTQSERETHRNPFFREGAADNPTY